MRRRGRECAVQILYQLDVSRSLEGGGIPATDVDGAIEHYWGSFDQVSAADRNFAERLVRGVVRLVKELDEAIAEVSHHWRVARMDRVDRSVLRLAAFEILHCPDIPRAASINEAIEIAKRFSNGDSAAFINGVLDHLHRDSDEGVGSGASARATASDGAGEEVEDSDP